MTDTAAPEMVQQKPIKKQSRASGQLMLALVVTTGFFGVLILAMHKPIPQENHDIVITLLAMMGTLMSGTWAYYFGSSLGSRNKEDILQAAATQPTSDDKNTATANVTIKGA